MSTLPIGWNDLSLRDWREVYRGRAVSLDVRAVERIERSCAAVQRIVARGEPVYGINTGFGKLASVRIDSADLTRLQHNLVLSHAAGVGEPTPPTVVGRAHV